MYMRNVCTKAMVLALTLLGLAMFANRAQAQSVTTYIQFNHTWKYLATGIYPGDLWRTNTTPPFSDAAWQSGPGLLGLDDVLAPYQVHVPGALGTTLPVSNTITSYYFRTTFNLIGSPTAPGLVLIATNLVDDGCAIWLNGRLAGGVRVPAGAITPNTFFAGPATEGQLDTVILTNFLRSGANTIAVEVHQTSATSSDVMFGMKLLTIAPTAITITNQPDSVDAVAGDPVSFTVGVSGGPAIYRWQKDGITIPNATNSTYSIASVSLSSAGGYRVIVSNSVNAATSTVAQLTVTEDTTGPRLVAAIIDNGFGSNRVNVRFDEALTNNGTLGSNPRNPANYRLVSATNHSISFSITNIQYTAGQGALLFIGDTNWNPQGAYHLIVNNIADRLHNQIAPYSAIGTSRQIFTNLTQMSDIWRYYDCADIDFCDPNSDSVYLNEAFARTNFVPDQFTWGVGNGIFVKESGLGEIAPCTGDTRGTFISFQLDPTLFRRTFVLPSNASSNGTLRLRFMFDDGMLLYLNGRPLYSNNCVGPITRASRAINQVVDATCQTNVSVAVDFLRPGTNWLVAAVVQHATHDADTVFGCEMDLVSLVSTVAPTNSHTFTNTLRLNRSRTTNNFDKLILSWPTNAYGFSLMYSTDIVGTGPRPDRHWFTNEANWTQVKDQRNPYTNALPPGTGPRRFYKLFREKLND